MNARLQHNGRLRARPTRGVLRKADLRRRECAQRRHLFVARQVCQLCGRTAQAIFERKGR